MWLGVSENNLSLMTHFIGGKGWGGISYPQSLEAKLHRVGKKTINASNSLRVNPHSLSNLLGVTYWTSKQLPGPYYKKKKKVPGKQSCGKVLHMSTSIRKPLVPKPYTHPSWAKNVYKSIPKNEYSDEKPWLNTYTMLKPTTEIDTQSQVYSDFRTHTNTTGCKDVSAVVPEKGGKTYGYWWHSPGSAHWLSPPVSHDAF